MKTQVQFITAPLCEELALLPKPNYEKLLEALEDYEDLKASRDFRAKLSSGEEELIPAEYVDRMLNGENKIKVWRDLRGMSAKALADAAGIETTILKQLERGSIEGSHEAMKRIADALRITVNDLVYKELDMTRPTYLTGPEVRKRYGVTAQTLIKWSRDETLGFPKPLNIRRRNFWHPEELDAFDEKKRKKS